MSHKIFRLVISLFLALALSFSVFTPALAAVPTNDNFVNAETITSLPFSATVDNTDATLEPSEPVGCGSSNGTVWYSFTPTQNMAVRVDMVGSVVSSAVSIYLSSGSGISNLTFLACTFSSTSANLNLEAGKTYYFQVTDIGQPGVLQLNLQQIFPPTNDNFANAETITSLPFSATVDNTDATTEPGEPQNCGSAFGTVWYSFTPAENMAVRVNMVGSAVTGFVNIYLASGPGISDLTFLGCPSSNDSTNFQVEVGKTYYLQLESIGQPGNLQVNLEEISPPANDGFANSEAISSLPFSANVDNTNATTEPDEPQGCSFPFRSVWYSFTPTESMTIQVDMFGSAVGGGVNIFLASGPTISDLTSQACAFSDNSTNFNVEAGKTYYLRVDSFSQPGALQINLEQIFPPANDNFANAEAISSLPFSATVDNTNATLEPDEPVGCGIPFRSVWYSFTTAENMAVRVSLAQNNASGNVSVFLASGSSISDLASLACVSNNGSSNILVEAGKTYYLRLDSFGQVGVLQINLEQIFPPANDNFVNAEVIASLPFSAAVDTMNATIEPGEPQDNGCGSLLRSVWYTVTPTEDMAVRVDTAGSAVGSIVKTYLATGPALSDLTLLACSFSGSTNMQMEAGKTYYLQVDSSGQAGMLQVNLEQITPPANDNFANAEIIPSLPFNIIVDNTDATIEPGEGMDCLSQFRSVWYSFIPTENTEVRMNTFGSTAPGNVSIYLASGSSLSDLTFLTCTTGGSSARIMLEAGKTYYLRVDSYGQAGPIQVNLAQSAPPANDNFANAEVITSLPFSGTVDTSEATLEPNESQFCTPTDRTVWYKFIPSATMILIADTRGGISPNVSIYRAAGPGITDLQLVQCVSPGGGITFLVESGQTYYLQVGAPFGQTGTVQFNLSEVTAITGRVTDAVTDAPLPGNSPPFAFVTLQRVCGDGCLELVSSGPTDSEGRFRFDSYFGSSLQAGTYQIEVSANLYQTKQFGPFEFSGANLDMGDLPIDPLPLIGSISGRVLDVLTGKPIAAAFAPSVSLNRCDQSGCFTVNSQAPDGAGQFRFETDYSGNPLAVGTYQVVASADQYEQGQTDPFDVGEGEHRVIDVSLKSFPVRFSEIQPCADMPASGGECAFSVKVWNGLTTKLKGSTWGMVNASVSNSFISFTDFQVKAPQGLELDKGKSRIFRFRFNVPGSNSRSEAFICTRVFVGQGNNSSFNTVGFRDLFCVPRNAQGSSIASPPDAMTLAPTAVTAAATGTETEPNNSCQTAQDVGAVPLPFVLNGNLDSTLEPDIDFYRFSGTAGLLIGIDHEGQATGKGTLADPLLGLFDSDCNLVDVNNDTNSANSRLEITIPSDGIFFLAATAYPDFALTGGGNGSYQLTVAPVQLIGSIRGRITGIAGIPLRGDAEPFAFVRLLHCGELGCFDVDGQAADREGRFLFESDLNGAPLRVGTYQLLVTANQHREGLTEQFAVGEGERHDVGDFALASYPVFFSEIKPCSLPADGGVCNFSVKITNGLSARLSGKAWSLINGSWLGSFTDFTAFQTDTLRDVKLDPNRSTTLRFRFRVPDAVADGATICASVYVGRNPSAFFHPEGVSLLFCLTKGTGGFTLLSEKEAQAAFRELQNSDFVLPNSKQNKKK